MEDVTGALEHDGVLTLSLLAVLGRQSLRIALDDTRWLSQSDHLSSLWNKLCATACDPSVADKHLTAACNAICVLFRGISHHSVCEVREFAHSRSTWFQGLAVVRKALRDGKNKPGLQVLEMLIQVLHEYSDQHRARPIILHVVKEMIEIIFSGSPPSRLKEACIVLTCFLRKASDIVPIDSYFDLITRNTMDEFKRRCLDYQIGLDRPNEEHKNNLVLFFLALLVTMGVSEPQTAALKLFTHLCSRGNKHDNSRNVADASLAIELYTYAHADALAHFSSELFPSLFSDAYQLFAFIEQYRGKEIAKSPLLELYLTILKVGRSKGYISEQELDDELTSTIVTQNRKQSAHQSILSCAIPHIRLQGCDLLTMSPSPVNPIPPSILACILENLPNLHCDADAHYRDVYCGIVRRLLERMEHSSRALKKRLGDDESETTEHDSHSTFVGAYIEFLTKELYPQAPYSRHILALDIIQLLQSKIGSTIVTTSTLASEALIMNVTGLLCDAYDDVRATSASILRNFQDKKVENLRQIWEARSVVRDIECLSFHTNRGDHADALGRSYLIEQGFSNQPAPANSSRHSSVVLLGLAKRLSIYLADKQVLQPTDSFPLHGSLTGAAHCIDSVSAVSAWEHDPELANELTEVCRSVWNTVQTELCIDSPETATDENDSTAHSGPKDLLACAWRALRDSSLMLQAVLRWISAEEFLHHEIGKLCLEQLILLKHRGAFSTVAQTFQLCCQKIRAQRNEHSRVLHAEWLEIAFRQTNEQASKLTRRSAGLPAIFAALIDVDDVESFKTVVKRLSEIASIMPKQIKSDTDEVELPQVHALNALKDIMTNSRFRAVTESLVVVMLNLAARCLAEEIWAVRNCGLMLFRACISRLTSEFSTTADGFSALNGIEVHDAPLKVALRLLNLQDSSLSDSSTGIPEVAAETVFAALDLLLRISLTTRMGDARAEIFIKALGHKLWNVRCFAARGLSQLIAPGDELSAIQTMLDYVKGTKLTSNQLHGRLLCAKLIMSRFESTASRFDRDKLTSCANSLRDWSLKPTLDKYHPVVLATYIEILNEIIPQALKYEPRVLRFEDMTFDEEMAINGSTTDYLLNRSSCLYKIYSVITSSDTISEQMDTPHVAIPRSMDILTLLEGYDTDALVFALDKISAYVQSNWPAVLQRGLLTLIHAGATMELKAHVMQILIDHLMAIEDVIPVEELALISDRIELPTALAPHAWRSQLQFISYICSACHKHGLMLSKISLSQVIRAVQEAASDEVEQLSREAALICTSLLIPLLSGRSVSSLALSEQDSVRLLIILYDLLNDDDEDIRRSACNIWHNLISQWGDATVMPCCSVLSRSRLLTFLREQYGHVNLLTLRALSKVLGSRHSFIDGDGLLQWFCRKKPVQSLMENVILSSQDLFAEEKQNLYIDTIAEIHAWIILMEQQSLSMLEPETLASTLQWTVSGLDYMQTFSISQSADNDHFGPFGPTYHEPILVLCMRVITMARILVRHFSHIDCRDGHESNVLYESCRTLRETYMRMGAHAALVDALKVAVGDQH